jgi:hypothetical protein
MAHGTRKRVWRVAVAGVGALLCGGLVGCMNTDKPKEKVPTKPGIGLPGTPTLTPAGGTAKTNPPTGTGTPSANLQPRVVTNGANTNTGTGIQPAGGFASPGGAQPGFGAGNISAPTPPAGVSGTVPQPSMPWPATGSNYPPGGPTNPVMPPMNDISPPVPFGAPGASVLPPQPAPGAQMGPIAPIGPG